MNQRVSKYACVFKQARRTGSIRAASALLARYAGLTGEESKVYAGVKKLSIKHRMALDGFNPSALESAIFQAAFEERRGKLGKLSDEYSNLATLLLKKMSRNGYMRLQQRVLQNKAAVKELKASRVTDSMSYKEAFAAHTKQMDKYKIMSLNELLGIKPVVKVKPLHTREEISKMSPRQKQFFCYSGKLGYHGSRPAAEGVTIASLLGESLDCRMTSLSREKLEHKVGPLINLMFA